MVAVEEVQSSDDEGTEDSECEGDARRRAQAWKPLMELSPPCQEDEQVREARRVAMRNEERARVEQQFATAEAARLEGNRLLAEADFALASDWYEDGFQALTMVGNEPESRERAEKANLALHLNVALLNLRRGQPVEAKDHATSALDIDPQNVKALYRRARASSALARDCPVFQDDEAKAACVDLEALLNLEPGNIEAQKELQSLRRQMQEQAHQYNRKQRETWGQVFGGRAPEIENDPLAAPEAPLRNVRQCSDKSRHLFVSLENVCDFGSGWGSSSSSGAVLRDLDLELREGWCVGLAGTSVANREALVRLLMQRGWPHSGRVVLKPKLDLLYVPTWMVAAAMVGVLAVFAGMGQAEHGPHWSMKLVAAIVSALVLAPLLALKWATRGANTVGVEHIAPAGSVDAAKRLKSRSTVESLIGDALPKDLAKDDRYKRVVSILAASGFEDLDTCLRECRRYGELPDGQKHLVRILRCIASKPAVLICEEPLADLEKVVQLRVVRMLKRMKQDCKTTILYLSDDLNSMAYVSDSLGLVKAGSICELGPTQEVLELPRTREMQEHLVGFCRDCPEIQEANAIGLEWHEHSKALLDDKALNGPWLPNLRGYVL